MKTLEELMALRDAAKANMTTREDSSEVIRIVVGMATCGIAAGARPVMAKFVDEVAKRGLTNVTVAQTGCIGMCRFEPIAEVLVPGKEKVTYVQLTEEKVARIIAEHIVNGTPVAEYTIGAVTE